MRQQLREQLEAVGALQGQLAAFQQEQQQSAEVTCNCPLKNALATHIPHCPSAVRSTIKSLCMLSFCSSVCKFDAALQSNNCHAEHRHHGRRTPLKQSVHSIFTGLFMLWVALDLAQALATSM